MSIRFIHSQAPTRIDLAGGTIDIWPLYLFLKEPITLNFAINLTAEASIELPPLTQSDKEFGRAEIRIESEDQNLSLALPWSALDNPPENIPSGLILHFKLLQFFTKKRLRLVGEKALETNIIFRTRAKSPAGAGLGGSSTLSIAMIGALAAWANPLEDSIEPERDGEKFIDIVRDIETTVIQVPAGLQDYYGAMFGGIQSLHWKAGSHHRERLPTQLIPELEKRLLLFYSGQSRNSGINNWALFKGFIDNESDLKTRFQQISNSAHQLKAALENYDWESAGKAISNEWKTRRTLASGISTPEIDSAFAEAAQLGSISGKVCGAGGGGCFFVYLPSAEPSKKAQIQKIFINRGMRSLDFQGAPLGLEVQVIRE